MLNLPRSVQVWIAIEPAHMGKNHDGLVGLVKERFGDSPFSGALYVFLGKRRDRCKIIWWEPSGWALHYKRLERGRIWLPAVGPETTRVQLDLYLATRPTFASFDGLNALVQGSFVE